MGGIALERQGTGGTVPLRIVRNVSNPRGNILLGLLSMSALVFEGIQEYERHLPSSGRYIIGQFNESSVFVYQAFNERIAAFAVKEQQFGGPDYDFNRMTWLKPSFLWMMHYSGWAKKENQEKVLAIRLCRKGFNEMLEHANLICEKGRCTPAQLDSTIAGNPAQILLRWEPYHDLFGKVTEREAVMIGLRGKAMRRYNEQWIQEIEDITDFVKAQQSLLQQGNKETGKLPRERVYTPDDLKMLRRIDASTISM